MTDALDLPASIAPPPEVEALALALEQVTFESLEADAAARAEAGDTETPPLRAFLLLDASRSPDIPVLAEAFAEEARCLFDGQAFDDLGDVGPWLIELRRHGNAFDWFVEDGWGNDWGIVIQTRLTLARLKVHLKKFIRVEDEAGEVYFFKFYRPRHLNTYLPLFDADQLARFMGPIRAIHAEREGDATILLRHRLEEDGALSTAPADLIANGMPLRIQPPDPAEVEALLARAAEGA